MDTVRTELEALINRNNLESASATPDYVLAGFLIDALKAFNAATRNREQHYGRGMGTVVGFPKDGSYFMPYAESAFNAYGDKAEWLTWDKKPMPEWDMVGDEVRARWLAAIKDVFKRLEVRDANSGALFVP